MASDVDIVNVALSKLGEPAILSFDDASPAGRLANRTYSDYRDALLREHIWNFAIARAELAASATEPVYEFGQAFPLPNDCLRVLDLNNPDDWPWRVEGRAILSDLAAPLQIRYLKQVTNPDEMDAAFREALAARLAMEWAEPLSQTTSVQTAMAQLYTNKLRVARSTDGQEQYPEQLVADTWIRARY